MIGGMQELRDTLSWPGASSETSASSQVPHSNLSGIAPVGRAILVEPYEPQRTKSLLVLPDHVKENERVMDVKVRVVAVGPLAFEGESEARAVPGDIIFVARFSGHVTRGPRDGKHYRLVNDRDVFAKVTWIGEPE